MASIEVHLGALFLCYAQYGQPRPDIGRDYPDYPQSHHAGFIFTATLGPEVAAVHGADLEFHFRTEDGSVSRRHVTLNWATPAAAEGEDDAARAWPIRLSLDDCRLDATGRLRLRGWAISRAPLTSLQLFLNDTPLHGPETGLPRPDIALRHPGYHDAAVAGFRLVQQIDTPAAEGDVVRVVARAGRIQRQIIVPLAVADSQTRLLRDGRVSLCCETLHLSPDGLLAITGWAVGEAETREIEVRADEMVLGTAEIGLPRPDIGNRFPRLAGARHAGFRFRQAVSIAHGAALTLLVRDEEGAERSLALRLPGTQPEPEHDAAPELIHAHIDTPPIRDGQAEAPIRGLLTIAGWAVSASGIGGVEVWNGDIKLGDAYLGVRREDVAASYPELPDALTSGFALHVPHRRLGDGEHALRIMIRARSGATTETALRVVLDSEDDSRTGAIRRVMPHRETVLRQDLLARLGPPPHVTVVIRGAGGGDGRGLYATLESLRRQSLTDWQAIVLVGDTEGAQLRQMIAADAVLSSRVQLRQATQDRAVWQQPARADALELMCLLRAGDRLGADALIELAVEARLSGANFIYADERCYDPASGVVRAFFKPGWSPDLLLSTNYIGRAWCATRSLVQRALVDLRRTERGGDYEAVLRLTEAADLVAHVPLSLFERAGRRGEAPLREQDALTRAAKRRGIAGDVLPGQVSGTWRLRRTVHDEGVVSVIIATRGAVRDGATLICRAIETLRATTLHRPVEIIVLDDIPATEVELKTWVSRHADRTIAMQGAFNWSRFNNLGAAAARGAFLLFLNDDTEFREPGWLEALLEHAQRPEIGAVGPVLLYPDGKVQHAGMFLRGSEARHAFRFAAADDPGPFGLAAVQRDISAVTGACLLTRRAVFSALGGFDEHHGVIMNDVDFCLRVQQAGLRVIVTPHARVLHHEMASRATLPDSFDTARFGEIWGLHMLRGDALLNPNLSRESDDMIAESEPVQWLQPGRGLMDAGKLRRIVVLVPDELGAADTWPALQRLRGAFPGATIDTVGAKEGQGLRAWTRLAAPDTKGDPAWVESGGKAPLPAIDLAIDLNPHPATRRLLRSTRATFLAGFDHGGRFPWLDIAVEWEGDARLADKRSHISATLLRLAGAVADAAALDLPWPGPDTAAVWRWDPVAVTPEFLARKLVCIHPGAATTLQQWPAASFAGLIRLLLAAHDLSVVLIGGPDHTAIAANIRAMVGRDDAVLSLAGQMDQTELPALLPACVLFVGNDSVAVHLAAALGIPTVGLYASHIDAAERGASGAHAIVLRRHMTCGPCYITREADCPRAVACLRGITPAQAYRACRLLLGFTFGGAGAGPVSTTAGRAARLSIDRSRTATGSGKEG
jgi:ADP-heptose:LPS heptosyltransferase/GT2 family glycosyltransferase